MQGIAILGLLENKSELSRWRRAKNATVQDEGDYPTVYQALVEYAFRNLV